MTDSLPAYVTEYRRWREAPPDQRDRLVRAYADHRQMFPDVDALHDGNTIAPNGKLLGDCTDAERGEFVDWWRAVRDAAVTRAKAVNTALCLAGLQI